MDQGNRLNVLQVYAVVRVGRYFDILIYRDIPNRDYRIEAKT